MAAKVNVHRDGATIRITLELRNDSGGSMLEQEDSIQDAVNEVGRVATALSLEGFDTDGSAITVNAVPFTSKGQQLKNYQTPYGEVAVERYVYQSGWGGATYCPLDQDARIINSSTPRFARIASYKYAVMKSTLAQKDLAENHHRKVSRCYLQDIAEEVATVVESKESGWRYKDPQLDGVVDRISLGIDGTTILFCDDGYREAMVGTISLYNCVGRRLHTIYVGAEPEYGKQRFYERMEKEIAIYKDRYPLAHWVGVADGAKDLWPWLQEHTQIQVLDFFHASGYLDKAAMGVVPKKNERKNWMDVRAHELKHEPGKVTELLEEMKEALAQRKLGTKVKEGLKTAITYYQNNQARMDYPSYRAEFLPIGSGVTEAACKTLVKERMCGSGMKWKSSGASQVLRIRGLIQTEGRWNQFWEKVSRYGT